MAGETLRDLVVSLSLDSDNFSRNIKSVNAQMREAEAAFKLAGAGIQNFENSMAGTAAKLDLVRSKYTLQEKAVQQFSRAMQAAENKLSMSKTAYDKQTAALAKLKPAYDEAIEGIKHYSEVYKAARRSLGEDNRFTIGFKNNLDAYKESVKGTVEAYEKLEKKLPKTQKSMQNNADAVTKANTAYNKAEAELKALRIELLKLESSAYNAGTWFSALAAEAEVAGRTLETAGRGLTRHVTTPLAALGVASAKASIDFETAFVGVRKTVDATETQYRRMATAIKDMSGEVADSAENIAGVAATAGQLGIVNDEIMSFTRTVQDLTVSTEDLKGTAAAEEIAKFANVAQMSQKHFSNLGSTLTYLGNNYATTEGAIMSMALNMAAAGVQVGLSEAQILGLAAGLSSVGLEAEKGGSAMSKALKQMEVAAQTGGQALEDFARISGMTEEQFKAVWESDPAAAFMAFIDGLARMDDEGISAIATMQEIGMSEIRLSDTMLRTVNAHELFNSALSDANTAWEENTALTEEANKFYGTTESRLKNLGNRAQNFAARLGDGLNPQMEALMGMADGLLTSLEGLDSAQMRTITRVGMWAAAVGPLSLGMGKLVSATGSGSNAIGKFLKSVAGINAQAKDANTSFLSVASSTLGFKAGVAGLSVALIAGAAALAYYTSNAYKTKAAIESMQDTVNDWKNTPTDTLFGGEGMSFFGLDAEAFTDMGKTTKTMEEWRDGLIKVWTDGQKETNAIVDEWTGAFTAMTDNTRQQLMDLKQSTGGENSLVAADIDEDLAMLDELDAEITALLKKRQNGLFTEDDIENLQEAIDKREAIVVKYSLQEATGKGYEEIAQGINDEMARAALEGRSVDFSVYEEGTLAAAQGYALITDELEKQYDTQRRILEAEGDQEKLGQLDYQYLIDRRDAAREYVDILKTTAAPIFESDDAEKAKTDMEELTGLVFDYQNAAEGDEKTAAFEAIDEWMKNADLDSIVEYIALVQQAREAAIDAGLSEEAADRAFGTGYADVLSSLGSVIEYLNGFDDTKFAPLKELFTELIPDEVKTINVELNRDDLADQIDAFAASPEAIVELKAVINPTGMDAVALAEWKRNNPIEVEAAVYLGSVYDNPEDAVQDQTARFFNAQGVEIPVTAIPQGALTENALVLLTEGEDGAIEKNIILNVAYGENSPEEILGLLEEDPAKEAFLGDTIPVDLSTLGHVESALRRIRQITGDGIMDMIFGYTPGKFQQSLDYDFGETEIGQLSAFVADVYKRLEEGGEVTEDEIEALKTITELLNELTSGLPAEAGVGTDIINEIQTEMEEAGWTGTAQDIDTELNRALDEYVGLYGAGQKAIEDFTAGALSKNGLVATVGSILGSTLAANMANPGAVNAGNTGGDTAPAGVASAGSFMGRVGGAMMESLGLGALKEAPNQAKIIGNAARYISTAAGHAIIGGGAYGAAGSTYNQQQTVNLTGNSFYVRSEQDINQLAYEIAAIMTRRSKGYGG